MDSYKLTYFNLKGIAEPIRLLFVYRDVSFENIELDCMNWMTIKKDIKWNQVPFLEYNGKVLTQSVAIINFLAEKFNLLADDAWKRAKCEEIIGAVNDLRIELRPIVQAKFGGKLEEMEELKRQSLVVKVPLFLKNLNEILMELQNSDKKSDFILGTENPVAADFVLAHYTDQWSFLLGLPDLMDSYELLKKQQEAVYKLPRIAKYVQTRPETII